MRRLWAKLRAVGRDDEICAEMDAEFEFHVAMKTAELERRGMQGEAAGAEAARSFGRVMRLREEGMDVRGGGWMEHVRRDLGFALRLLRNTPGRTALLVATLALGIGISGAMFNVIRCVLLEPLPFADAGRLVVVHQADHGRAGGVSYPNYLDWRESGHAAMAVYAPTEGRLTIAEGGATQHAEGAVVSARLFRMLGVRPLRGRLFHEDEDKLGGGDGARPLLISESLWKARFGGRDTALGKAVTLDGLQFRVAGVIPAGQEFPPSNTGLGYWITVAVDAEPSRYGGSIPKSRGYPRYEGVLWKLPAGEPLEHAQAEMNALASRVAQAHPKYPLTGVTVRTALEEVVGDVRPMLLLLYGAVLCVLAVACANAGTLLLVGAVARRREFGIRAALGAMPGRIFQQVLLENLLLGALGGVAGTMVAWCLVAVIPAIAPTDTPRLSNIRMDVWTVGYLACIAMAAGALAGLAPAFAGMRRRVQGELAERSRSSTASKGSLVAGRWLMVAQVALCMLLTCAAAVFTSSFQRIVDAPRGFDAHGVTTAVVSLPPVEYPQASDRVRGYFRELLRKLRANPAVEKAAIAETLPLSGGTNSTTVKISGHSESGTPETDLRFVDPAYFAVLRIPVVSGRGFAATDDSAHAPVALVNQAFVRRYFAGGAAVEGVELSLGWGGEKPKRIVGVVGDVKHKTLAREAVPEVYVPAEQFPNNSMAVLVRMRNGMDGAGLLRSLDGKLETVRTLDDYLQRSAATQRFLMTSLVLLAGSTLLVAALGLYGMLMYTTATRAQEFGIRMALGSRPGQLSALVLRQGLGIAAAGVSLGLALSFAVAQGLTRWLYDTAPLDPKSLFAAMAVLFVVAVAACWWPALRAGRTDAMLAIRSE